MDNIIDCIRTAISADATPEAKAAGITACRAVLTALEGAAPGASLAAAPASPIATIVGALRGVPPDQLLDLAIAKLRAALPVGTDVPPVQPLKLQIVPIPHRG